MSEFFKRVFLENKKGTDTDAIIRVDRYARELRSYIMYLPVDKVSICPITSAQVRKLNEELRMCEHWVDENQYKLIGL